MKVINPFEPLLAYPDEKLAVRRDQPEISESDFSRDVPLSVAAARPARRGVGDYIETTLDDIAIANELATELFGHSLDELSRPGRELLRQAFISDRPGGATKGGAGRPSPLTGASCGRRSSGATIGCGRTWTNWWKWNTCCPSQDARASPSVTGFSTTARARAGDRFLSGLKSVEHLRREAGRSDS